MKLRRWIGTALTLLLAIVLLGTPRARAAVSDVELTTAESGGSVKVTLWARADLPLISDLEFNFSYDPSAFTFGGMINSVDPNPAINMDSRTVSLVSEPGITVPAGMVLVELTFTKTEYYVKGTQYTFGINFTEAFDSEGAVFDWASQAFSGTFSEEPDPPTGTIDLRGINIRKTIDTNSEYPAVTFTFTFEKKSAPAGADAPVFDPMSVTVSGTTNSALLALPGQVWVDAPGTYEYTVREQQGAAEGWSYDSSAYVLRLVVTYDAGTGYRLSQWNILAPNGASVTEMNFKNTYVAPQAAFQPPEVRFKIRQIVNLGSSGLTANDVIVRYTLQGQSIAAPLPTGAKEGTFQVALRGTGTYQAPIITYNQPGTWKYNLTATSTNADITPQTIVITVTVDPTGEARVTSALTNGVASDIQFTANARTTPTPSPTPTPRPGTVQTPTPTPKKGTTPKTADSPRVYVFSAVSIVAGAVLAVLIAWELRDRKKKKD